jgi:toxin ParE1/3/4
MVQIIWSKLAREDIKSIKEYISKDSEVYAKNTILKIKKKVDLLIQNPNLGRDIPEVNNPIYREIIEGNYRIMFKKVGFEIQILTIFHGARAFQKDLID